MKKKNRGRELNALLVLDKPAGMSSNRALQRVKYLFDAKKAGHTGTLDPLATGVLVICFGNATKIAQHIMNASKTYYVVVKLGEVTDTGDREGEVIENTNVTPEQLEQLDTVVRQFEGEIEQLPPMFSAIKQNGVPLYKLARAGVQVSRATRNVKIYSLKLGQIQHQAFAMTVHCSKGTYIRTLVEDIGRKLGCGAHVIELRRQLVGAFGEGNAMYTIADLEQIAEQGMQA